MSGYDMFIIFATSTCETSCRNSLIITMLEQVEHLPIRLDRWKKHKITMFTRYEYIISHLFQFSCVVYCWFIHSIEMKFPKQATFWTPTLCPNSAYLRCHSHPREGQLQPGPENQQVGRSSNGTLEKRWKPAQSITIVTMGGHLFRWNEFHSWKVNIT